MGSSARRVVVTGLGAVTCLGDDLNTYLEKLKAGESGARPVSLFDASEYNSRFAGECTDFDACKWIEDRRQAKRMSRFSQFAVACATQAVEDGRLDAGSLVPERSGAIIASGIGGLVEMEEQVQALMKRGPGRTSPFFIPKLMMNAAPAHVAMKYNLRGPNFSIASACASANHAVGIAYRLIKSGQVDLVLAGGSEAGLTPTGLAGFCALKALSTRNDDPKRASRPFDKDRDGFVLGEGAGVLLLETLEHAEKRGATLYAEILGAGETCDAYHITAPDPEGKGAARAIELALKEGCIDSTEVNYVNAHGTSTLLNDASETAALKAVFGDYARKLAISSTKSMIGHLLGGSGGAEMVASILCMRNGFVHPTINYDTPDPDCDLDYIPNEFREMRVNYFIKNSFGFGGHNSCLLFKNLC